MINIVSAKGRSLQQTILGYSSQTHSLAELISEPVKVKAKPFCNCKKIDHTKIYRVTDFGLAYVAQLRKDGNCDNCGHAPFWSNKFEAAKRGEWYSDFDLEYQGTYYK